MPANKNTTTLGNYGHLALSGPYLETGTGKGTIFEKIFDFEWERLEERIHRGYISGERDKFTFPNGYSGSFNFDRTHPTMEDVIAAADAQFDQDGTYQNWTLTFDIKDPTGSGSRTLRFYGCALTITKGGTYRQNQVVTTTCHFESATMQYDAYQ